MLKTLLFQEISIHLPETATFMKTITRIIFTVSALALPQIARGQMSAGNEPQRPSADEGMVDSPLSETRLVKPAGGAYLYSTDNRKAL